MAFIANLLMSGAGLGKMASGGAVGRAALGGVIGAGVGAYGAMNSNDPNQKLSSIATGALVGAIGGASTRLMTPAVRYGKSGAMTTGMPVGMKALGMAGTMGLGATKFAFRNPRLTAAIGGTALGAYATAQIAGSTTSSLDYDVNDYNAPYNPAAENAALSSMAIGVSPMGGATTGTTVRANRVHQSTFGLVQGLNRGRH